MKERRRDAAVSDVWIDLRFQLRVHQRFVWFVLRFCGRWFVWNKTSVEPLHQEKCPRICFKESNIASLSAPCRTTLKVFNISSPWRVVTWVCLLFVRWEKWTLVTTCFLSLSLSCSLSLSLFRDLHLSSKSVYLVKQLKLQVNFGVSLLGRMEEQSNHCLGFKWVLSCCSHKPSWF